MDKIEIQGFKSFAQKTTLTFPQPKATGDCGIACIVGPNGSGKSNIVDAIRWVLGEQSLKSLRGKKSQDVIFSGSEKKSRLSIATVSLYINNEDHAMPVDYDEVVISRKIYRNGESEYRINTSRVRLQDILLLVARSNFGQKSYSIVSQGSIDRVIMANPAERKNYFDEAVGVKQFQIKRDQSINKLENAWNNLLQVDALLTEIKPRLGSLTRQVKRLERREKVELQLKEAQQRYYGWLNKKITDSTHQFQPRLTEAENKLTAEAAELKTLQQQLEKLEKKDSPSKSFSQLQRQHQQLLEQKNKLREEQLMLQNKIELAEQQRGSASPVALTEIVKQLKTIDALEQKLLGNLDRDINQAKADAQKLGQLIAELLGRLEQPSGKTGATEKIDPDLLADLEATKKDLTGLEKQVADAQTALENFNQKQEKEKGDFFAIQKKISGLQANYNQRANTVSELRVEMAKLETQQQNLEREINDEMGDTGWLATYQAEKIDETKLHDEVIKYRRQLELIGGVEPEVVDEYQKVKERHDFLDEQAEDLRASIKSLEKVINDLDDRIQEQFDSAFKRINKEFTKFFKILFAGGTAELILIKEDPTIVAAKQAIAPEGPGLEAAEEQTESESQSILDQLKEAEKQLSPKRFLKKRTGKVITGIDIAATPPGKKVSSINMLSGGERSLASIALICAIISNNPSPFVILDEVDAALDEANSQRFAKILEDLAHKTQFIVITHNRATMQKGAILYGVTMGDDGISRLISLQLEQAAKIVRQ